MTLSCQTEMRRIAASKAKREWMSDHLYVLSVVVAEVMAEEEGADARETCPECHYHHQIVMPENLIACSSH